jgi:hypothetical protein
MADKSSAAKAIARQALCAQNGRKCYATPLFQKLLSSLAAALAAYSRGHRFVRLHGRTEEGGLVQHVRDELLAHVHHKPSAVERVMIERCCWLQLRLSMLDKKLAAGRDFTQIDSNVYLAWHNSLIRTLVKLGLNPKPKPNTFDRSCGSR